MDHRLGNRSSCFGGRLGRTALVGCGCVCIGVNVEPLLLFAFQTSQIRIQIQLKSPGSLLLQIIILFGKKQAFFLNATPRDVVWLPCVSQPATRLLVAELLWIPRAANRWPCSTKLVELELKLNEIRMRNTSWAPKPS